MSENYLRYRDENSFGKDRDMCNTIRMELYKLFRIKSFFVLAIITIAMVVLTAAFLVDDIEENTQAQSTQIIGINGTENGPEDNSVQFGISESVEGMDVDNLAVLEIYGQHLSSGLFILFNVIFLVLYVTADIKNGYIKNIGGQVKHRSSLIWSKWAAAAAYVLVFDVVTFLVEAVSMRISLGYLYWGSFQTYLPYIGIQVVLQYSFLVACMTITMVLRSRAFGMLAGTCLSMGVAGLICTGLDAVCDRFFSVKDLHLENYLLTTKMSELLPGAGAAQIRNILLLAVAYLVVSTLVSLVSVEKRDLL